MKAKIIFNLPEDNSEYQAVVNASNLALVLFEFDQWLRSEQKYSNREEIPVDELREKLRDLIGDQGLNFEHVIFQ